MPLLCKLHKLIKETIAGSILLVVCCAIYCSYTFCLKLVIFLIICCTLIYTIWWVSSINKLSEKSMFVLFYCCTFLLICSTNIHQFFWYSFFPSDSEESDDDLTIGRTTCLLDKEDLDKSILFMLEQENQLRVKVCMVVILDFYISTTVLMSLKLKGKVAWRMIKSPFLMLIYLFF